MTISSNGSEHVAENWNKWIWPKWMEEIDPRAALDRGEWPGTWSLQWMLFAREVSRE